LVENIGSIPSASENRMSKMFPFSGPILCTLSFDFLVGNG
jgi:hypothetical protein